MQGAREGDNAYIFGRPGEPYDQLRKCVLRDWNEAQDSWEVEIENVIGVLMVKRQNLMLFLRICDRVKLHSLSKDTHLNGKQGMLANRHATSNHWTFRTETGYELRVRTRNLSAIVPVGTVAVAISNSGAYFHRCKALIFGENHVSKQIQIVVQTTQDFDGTPIELSRRALEVNNNLLFPWPQTGDVVTLDDEEDVDLDEEQVVLGARARDQEGWWVTINGQVLLRTCTQFRTTYEDTEKNAEHVRKLLNHNLLTKSELEGLVSLKTDQQFDCASMYPYILRTWQYDPFLELAFQQRQCTFCSNLIPPSKPQLKCSECKIYHYCSRVCQKQDWKRHKKECTPYYTSTVMMRPSDTRYRRKRIVQTATVVINLLNVMNTSRENESLVPSTHNNYITDYLNTFDAARYVFFPICEKGVLIFMPLPIWVYQLIAITESMPDITMDHRWKKMFCAFLFAVRSDSGGRKIDNIMLRHMHISL